MPRVAASNGVRPEIRALAVIELNKPVTPAEINAHVGTGDYAAKYISFLKNRYGFGFTVQKDGKTVVSYTMVSEPANVAELRAAQPKSKTAPAPKAKTPKVKAKAQPKARLSKQTPIKAAARNILKEKADKEADRLLAEIGAKNAGEVGGGTYSVDSDWDSMDGIDVANFLK